jgi:hypothetical protein
MTVCFVILSRADGEGSRCKRSFATLRMTVLAYLLFATAALAADCAAISPLACGT